MLVGYDTGATGPLHSVHVAEGLLGGALVLARDDDQPGLRMRVSLDDGMADTPGVLGSRGARNPMAPMLPLFDALAAGAAQATLDAGAGRALRVELMSYNFV